MTYARKSLVCLQDTPYYHVVARCVRRAWLWGVDEYAGKDYSHRKAWVIERLTELDASFAIDICAYAVMSNHYHLVLHVDQRRVRSWTDHEVVERWAALFSRLPIVERWQEGLCGEAEQELVVQIIEGWRRRLCDVSWYMRCLNEHLARRANKEDGCTGRFWQGRFRSQALLDEAGLLTAMVYVDLNPVRAGIAATAEGCQFTSIQQRIKALKRPETQARKMQSSAISSTANARLLEFRSSAKVSGPTIPFTLHDYVALVDWTVRSRHHDQPHAIGERRPAIISRLILDADGWRLAMRSRGSIVGRALGKLDHLRLHAKTLGQSWIQGLRKAEQMYCSS